MFQRNLVIAMLFVSGSQGALVAEGGHTIEGLGTVSFPVSCRPELQPAFERGVALLHSFEYVAAREAFERVSADDPACAMAHWGVAMSHFHPLWAAPTAAELAAGLAASARAAELASAGPGSRVTKREFGYIAAIGSFWSEGGAADHKTRAARYRDAMAGQSLRIPEDADAAVFHALAILGTAPPADPEHKMQKQAAAILAGWLPRLPNHPGITHYSIHAFDSPELAYLGLDAARRYARIAPAAAHALHMPSHIFVRLGLWPETIASNLDAAASARAAIARTGSGRVALEELHALDYLEYAYLQAGDDERARAVAEQVARTTSIEAAALQATYGLAAIPARYALERRQWSEAAALELPSNLGVDWAKFPQMAAINSYARAVGAAKIGDQVAAGTAISELAAFHQSLVKAPPPGPYDWAASVESLRLAAAGCLEQARGNPAEALTLLRSAADLADKVGKHPVTPGTVLPQRELLADLLLELDRPREALVEYEASLSVAPNRLHALAGAARAADLAGEEARARTFANLVSALASPASTRPEVVAARELVGK